MNTRKHDKRKRIRYGVPEPRPEEISSAEWRQMWNVPDWRNGEGDYPDLVPVKGKRPSKSYISQDQLRWEFLRRDTDYRETWELYEEGKLKVSEYHPGDDVRPHDESTYKLHLDEYEYLRLFDLNFVIDPRIPGVSLPEEFFARWRSGRRILRDQSNDIHDLIKSERYEVLVFDVHRPLDIQITRAEETLYSLQAIAKQKSGTLAKDKKRSGHRRGTGGADDDVIMKTNLSNNFPKLLRILDAYLDSASPNEICARIHGKAKVTQNNKRTIHENINSAIRMWEWL